TCRLSRTSSQGSTTRLASSTTVTAQRRRRKGAAEQERERHADQDDRSEKRQHPRQDMSTEAIVRDQVWHPLPHEPPLRSADQEVLAHDHTLRGVATRRRPAVRPAYDRLANPPGQGVLQWSEARVEEAQGWWLVHHAQAGYLF